MNPGKNLLLSKALIGVLLSTATEVSARVQCAEAPYIHNSLKERYGESVVWEGQKENGQLVQLWVTKDQKTWTVVQSLPESTISCILEHGDSWVFPQ